MTPSYSSKLAIMREIFNRMSPVLVIEIKRMDLFLVFGLVLDLSVDMDMDRGLLQKLD